jgi:hypothetical protein
MDEGAALVMEVTDRLLGDLADAVPAFRAVGDALAVVADRLGVEKVVVAVDDAHLGRQVFCSRRAHLGDDGLGLTGPAGIWTQPPTPVADDVALLLRAVAVGVARATSRRAEIARTAAAEAAIEPIPHEPVSLRDVVGAATARAVRHGWGFTLVLVRGGPGLTEGLRRALRAADTLVAVSDHELALLLPETAGDRVPQVLARLAQSGGVPPFSYGLVSCPADGTDPTELCRTVTERLDEAMRAAVDE